MSVSLECSIGMELIGCKNGPFIFYYFAYYIA